jgi:predicted amidohydrolase YtcJ
MTLAGISANDKISGGEIDVRHGLLMDNAMNPIWKAMPEKSLAEDENALMAAQENCLRAGLTTVSDAGLKKKDIDLIKQLQASGKLKMRIYAMLADDSTNLSHYLLNGIDTVSNMLTVRAFKFYADGALGSRGACLLDPYNDLLPEKKYGLMLSDPDYFRRHAKLMKEKGFQMCTHAIGDSANRVILDIYGEVAGDIPDHRWRIEHAQVIHENDLEKFGLYRVIPSVQPTHATSDMPWAPERLGRNRMYRAYAYRKLKDQLGMVALGTDFPVEGISPLHTFYSAVYRKRPQDKTSAGFQMEDALSREDALRGMTIWAAIANFQENDRGSIEIGKQADLVITPLDLMQSEAIIDSRMIDITTLIAGKKVSSRED